MINTFKIALRNLKRYRRRTLLTSLLIMVGVVMVILFSGLSGSFKGMMIGQITDSNLAQMQIHKRGYVSSIDTMPLNLNLNQKEYKKIEKMLMQQTEVAAYAPRIKLGAMLSNFTETTNIRINAVDPEREVKVCPAVEDRILSTSNNKKGEIFIKTGEVIIPEKLAKGMKIEKGNTVVIVANNREGSVNGLNFIVAGIIEDVLGPQGKEGYMHIDDARALLRMKEPEVTEVAIRLKNFDKLDTVFAYLKSVLAQYKNPKGVPVFEIHTWEKLSPFNNIAKMIDIMTVSMKIIMIAIVLISILNVMIMSVYERIREIGTMSAIGTTPGKIMALFLAEGFSLGVISTLLGNVIGLGGIYLLNIYKIRFSFGRMDDLVLSPVIDFSELYWVSAIVLLVSVFASLQPAYKASEMEPVDALRHV
ncbi:MAG: FtsX-like permease family protein [Thermodesulfobacteriota bacterium]|nr:FtsX-like permease family protein [Thermodesulfobacteriota bacterium]